MTWNISTDIGEIDLEDAAILEIKRLNNEIQVLFNFARVSLTNKSKVSKHDKVDLMKLTFCGVDQESSHQSLGDEIVAANPEFPLDLIETVEYTPGKIVLSGYLQNKPWYSWQINFANLTLSWSSYVAKAT